MSNFAKTLIGIATIAVVIGAVIALSKGSDNTATAPVTRTETSATASPVSNSQQAVTVRFDGKSFQPNKVAVASGGKITFINDSNRAVEPTSDPHPTHTMYPALTVGNIAPGQQGSTQTLSRAGTWGMHDHQDSSIKLTVTVQ